MDLAERIHTMKKYYEDNMLKRNAGHQPSTDKTLALKNGENLKKVTSVETVDDTVRKKMQEMCKGTEVTQETVVLEGNKPDGKRSTDISGRLIEGIENGIASVEPRLSVTDALEFAVKNAGNVMKNVQFNPKTDAKLKRYVKHKTNGDKGLQKLNTYNSAKVHLVYYLVYKVARNGKVLKLHYIIEANTGQIFDKWQAIEASCRSQLSSFTYKSVGGNVKTGMYRYDDKKQSNLKIQRIGNTCIFENYAIRVINLFNIKSDWKMRHYNKTFTFDCKKGFNDTVNGGFSAVSDVLHHATVVYDMYKKWYKTKPLKFKLSARVHYGTHYENALGNRKQISFGDGYRNYYPFVSQDIVGHEIGHSIVSQNSGLILTGQPGGINEAFADITGEASEYFSRGKVDWLVGRQITKKRLALRFYRKPSRDGKSIDHASQFCPGQTPGHISSGVYRVVYYSLVHKPGWNIKKAYHVFVLANKLYWRAHSDFGDGACGCVKAAIDLGYNVQHVREAFMSAGIVPCQSELLLFSDLNGNKDHPIFFKWDIGTNVAYLEVRTTQGYGNVDIYIKKGSLPKSYSYDAGSKSSGNEDKIQMANPFPGTYYILLSSPTSFSGVGITTHLKINSNGTGSHIMVQNLESPGVRKRDDMLRLTFTLPSDAHIFILKGKTATGHMRFFLRHGVPVEASKLKKGYDLSTYFHRRSHTKTFCNMKAGVYHVLVGSEVRFNGGTITYSYSSKLIRISK